MGQSLDLTNYLLTHIKLLDPTTRLIPLMFLMLCRLVPVVHLSMFLGARTLPIPLKVGISIGLFIFVLPTVLETNGDFFFGYGLIFLILKEFFLGFLMGLMLAVPFYIIQMGGMLIDHQRGASSLMGTDPVLMIQDSSLGVLFVYIMVIIYWQLELPFKYIEIISQSFQVIPLDAFLPVKLLDGSSSTLQDLQALIGKIFHLALQLAAPSLIVLLMTDMFLGIVNRLAPQVMISFLAQALKALAALAIILAGWNVILITFSQKAIDWSDAFYKFVMLLKY